MNISNTSCCAASFDGLTLIGAGGCEAPGDKGGPPLVGLAIAENALEAAFLTGGTVTGILGVGGDMGGVGDLGAGGEWGGDRAGDFLGWGVFLDWGALLGAGVFLGGGLGEREEGEGEGERGEGEWG